MSLIWFALFPVVLIWAHLWGDKEYGLYAFAWYLLGWIPSAIIAAVLGLEVFGDDDCWQEVDPRGGRYIQYCEP
jgi:hypothetical protein